jgi:hypothetical protein
MEATVEYEVYDDQEIRAALEDIWESHPCQIPLAPARWYLTVLNILKVQSGEYYDQEI